MKTETTQAPRGLEDMMEIHIWRRRWQRQQQQQQQIYT